MKMKVYSIKDLAVGAFAPPFLARANGEAARMFTVHMKEKVQPENRKDYILYQIAEYDDDDGSFTNNHAPIVVMTGHYEQTQKEQDNAKT